MEGRVVRKFASKAAARANADREERESAAASLMLLAKATHKRGRKRGREASRKAQAAAHDAASAVAPPAAALAPARDVSAFPAEPAAILQGEEDVIAALIKLTQGEAQASSSNKKKAAKAVADAPRHAAPGMSPPPPAPAPAAGGSQPEPVFEPSPLAVSFPRDISPALAFQYFSRIIAPQQGYQPGRAPVPAPAAPARVVVSAAPQPPPAPAPARNAFTSGPFAPVSSPTPVPFQYYFSHPMTTPPAAFNRAPALATPPQQTLLQTSASLARLSQLQALCSLNTLRPLMFPSQYQTTPPFYQPYTTTNTTAFQPSLATAARNTTAFQPYTTPGMFTAPPQHNFPLYNWPANTTVGPACGSGGLPNPPTILGVVPQFVTGGSSTSMDANASSSAAPVLSQAHFDLYRLLEVQAAGGLGNVPVDDASKQDGRRKKKRRGGA